MYTPLEEAKEEVWKRWNDAQLRRRVLEYVGELPTGFGREPRAVYTSQLATGNFEYIHFAKKASNAGLKPLCAEYIHSGSSCACKQHNFLTSLVIANVYWTVAAYMGISVVEWLWRVVIGRVW